MAKLREKAIADVLSDGWAMRCRDAALALSAERGGEDEERGPMLLSDLKAIFEAKGGKLYDTQGVEGGTGPHTPSSCKSCTR